MVEILQESMVERARLDRLARTSGSQVNARAQGGSHEERPPPSIADVLAACGAALVEATPAIDFIALCATSKRTAAVTDPTVLKALEEQLPVLGSEFVKRRLAAASHPLRVLTSLAQQTRQRPRDTAVTRTCEVVCEIKLDCGGRIVQRGQLTDVKAFDFGVEDAHTCAELQITGANHDVVISKTGINYYELSEGWMFNQALRPEEAHLLAARPVEEWTEEAERAAGRVWTIGEEWEDLLERLVGSARVFLVREDGKSLLVFEDRLRLNFQHPHKEQLSRDHINLEGYDDTPEHEFAMCLEARRLVNMRSMATPVCEAEIITKSAPIPLPGSYQDGDGRVCPTHFGIRGDAVKLSFAGIADDNLANFFHYLDFVGDWR